MELKLDSYHPQRIVQDLAKELGVKTNIDCLEEYLDIPKKLGKGKVSGFVFSDGVGLLIISGSLKEDLSLIIKSQSTPPVIIKFGVQGKLYHELNDKKIVFQTDPMQGSLSATQRYKEELIRIGGSREVLVMMVIVVRKLYGQKIDCYIENMPERLQGIFNDTSGENSFMYKGHFSAQAMDDIQSIREDVNADIIRATFLEGKTLELMSSVMKQYRDDQRGTESQLLLRKFDLDKIREAKNILKANVSDPPTIVELSKVVGINQTKLKKGFKYIYDTTIKKFIINERLELAKIMILQDEHNLKEISSKIGYSNRSHFSRIFKRKFGVLPKEYVNRSRARVAQILSSEEE